MVQVESCPERDILEQLMRGQLAGTAGERLAQHLESCDRCAGVAHDLAPHDTLVEAARAASTLIDGPDAAPLRRLVERLHRLGSPVAAEGPTTSGDTHPADSPRAAGPARYDFLAPPAGPGEIGRLGRYRIVKLLGAGGMGIVFQAEDPRLKRTVALKVLKPEAAEKPRARARFLREAQTAARLEHEHVVTIFEVNDEAAVPYLAMQCLVGISLEDRLRRSGPLSVPQVLRLGRQIARGLAAAHAHGLIHRDIKPANLWLAPEHGGHVKILDFGLARAAEDEEHLTQSGALVGTPAYMAPEQARGEAVDARSDLFSLGVVLYRLTSGRLPFRGDGTMAILTALATQTPTPLRDLCPTVPPALADLVMQLLEKDAAARPRSAAEVAERLHAIERGTTPAPEPTATEVISHIAIPLVVPVAALAPPPRRRRRWPFIAAAILLVLLPLAYFFGGTVIRIATNRGQLVIEVNDPQVEVTVKEKGAVIQDRPGERVITLAAGEHEVEVTITDAIGKTRFFTRKLTLERGGKVIVNAWQELAQAKPKAAPVVNSDPDRRAAEWVLSVGGKLAIDGRWIEDAKDLPAGHFRVTHVNIEANQLVDDASLLHLRDLLALEWLDLNSDRVTDAGLVTLKGLPNLRNLAVVNTEITDAGLVHIKAMVNLEHLAIYDTKITEAGLVHLRSLRKLRDLSISLPLSDRVVAELKALPQLTAFSPWRQPSDDCFTHLAALPQLTGLSLYGSKVSDAGLARLNALPNLVSLDLWDTPVSDAGVARLKDLSWWPKLQGLILNDTRITDACLVHLQGMPDLTGVWLARTRISDAVIPRLLAMPKLQEIYLQGTRVSANGYAALKAAFPKGKILWSEPNRMAAETVLALGGTVAVRVKGKKDDRLVKAAADLPGEYFKLTRVDLRGIAYTKKSRATLLSQLAALTDHEFDRLEALDLSTTDFADTDVAHLEGLTALTDLSLARTPVGDATLARLKPLSALRRLDLDGTAVHGFGVRALRDLPKLTELRLGCPKLTDLFMPEVGDLKQLERLSLAGSKVSDDGLKHLGGLSALRELDLSGTQVTAEGAATLAKALPQCKVIGPGDRGKQGK